MKVIEIKYSYKIADNWLISNNERLTKELLINHYHGLSEGDRALLVYCISGHLLDGWKISITRYRAYSDLQTRTIYIDNRVPRMVEYTTVRVIGDTKRMILSGIPLVIVTGVLLTLAEIEQVGLNLKDCTLDRILNYDTNNI